MDKNEIEKLINSAIESSLTKSPGLVFNQNVNPEIANALAKAHIEKITNDNKRDSQNDGSRRLKELIYQILVGFLLGCAVTGLVLYIYDFENLKYQLFITGIIIGLLIPSSIKKVWHLFKK